MITGLVLLAVTLIVYVILVARSKSADKKMKKWAFLAAALTAGLSILIILDISLSGFTNFLFDTAGKFTGMVVKK